MDTWLTMLAAAAALAAAAVRMKLFIAVTYRRRGADDILTVRVWAFGSLINYRMDVPMLRVALRNRLPWVEARLKARGTADTRAGAEQRFVRRTWDIYRHHPRHWRRLVRQYHYYTRMYRRFVDMLLRAVVCEKISWATRIGTGDAAVTAVAAGALWAVKSHIHLLMRKRLARTAVPRFRVTPQYGDAGLEMDLECIFSLRLGNVINAIWGIIQFPGKGVKEQWASTRSRA